MSRDSVVGLLSNVILSHNADVSIKPYYLRPNQENPYRLIFFPTLFFPEKNTCMLTHVIQTLHFIILIAHQLLRQPYINTYLRYFIWRESFYFIFIIIIEYRILLKYMMYVIYWCKVQNKIKIYQTNCTWL